MQSDIASILQPQETGLLQLLVPYFSQRDSATWQGTEWWLELFILDETGV